MRISFALSLLLFAAASAWVESVELPEDFRDAPAVILEDSREWKVYPRKHAEYRVRQRILVQDPRSFEGADRIITYDAHRSSVDSLKVRTVLPSGEVVELSDDLKHDSELYVSTAAEWRSLQFTFPAVSPGAILELDYHVHYHKETYWKTWEPQDDIPVLKSRLYVEVRQPPTMLPLMLFAVPRGGSGEWCEVTERKSTDRVHKIAVSCTNVPAFESEVQAPPELDSRFRMEVMWGHKNLVDEYWKSVGERLYARLDGFSRSSGTVGNRAREITRGASSVSRKVDLINEWVRGNLTVRDLSLGVPGAMANLNYRDVDEVLENRGGTRQEITLFVHAMLKATGVPSRVIMVRDRSHGEFLRNALDSLDHLMLEVKLEGGWSAFDPSCDYCRPGLTDWRYTSVGGPTGIRLAQVPGQPLTLAAVPAQINREVHAVDLTVDESGRAVGEGRVRWMGQVASELRRRWDGLSHASRREELISDVSETIDLGEVEVSDLEETLKDPTATFKFHDIMYTSADGALLLRPLDLFSGRLKIPVQEHREHALWFPFTYVVEAATNFKLPEGYVAQLPSEPVRELEGPGMKLFIQWKRGEGDREVSWSGELTVNVLEVPTSHYEQAREFARNVRHLMRDGIVAERTSGGSP